MSFYHWGSALSGVVVLLSLLQIIRLVRLEVSVDGRDTERERWDAEAEEISTSQSDPRVQPPEFRATAGSHDRPR
jgi:hypothetical protein